MFTLNNKMITGIGKRILVLFIAFAFLLNSVSFAWARSGNYGENNSFSQTLTGAFSGASTSASGSWGDFGTSVATSIGANLAGLYMYIHMYNEYGKPIIQYDIAGKRVSISQGQLYSMVLSTAVSCVAGAVSSAASGSFNAGDWASTTAQILVKNTATLLVSETVKDVAHGYGLDETIAQIAGDVVASYAAEEVDEAIVKSVGMLTGYVRTQSGKWISGKKRKDTEIIQAMDEKGENTVDKKADFRKEHGHDYSPIITMSGSLKSMGTAPLIRAGMKITFLLAMGYSTYYGKDKHKRLDNAILMAMANGVGEVFADQYGSGQGERKWAESLAKGLGTAISDIAWQYFLHTVGINSDVTTEFARLVFSGAARGLLTKKAPTFEEYMRDNKKEKITKEDYYKKKYFPATVKDGILWSIGKGFREAELTSPTPVDTLKYTSNMQHYISLMARGSDAIQAQAGVLSNSFHSVANQNFGESTRLVLIGGSDSKPPTAPPGPQTTGQLTSTNAGMATSAATPSVYDKEDADLGRAMRLMAARAVPETVKRPEDDGFRPGPGAAVVEIPMRDKKSTAPQPAPVKTQPAVIEKPATLPQEPAGQTQPVQQSTTPGDSSQIKVVDLGRRATPEPETPTSKVPSPQNEDETAFNRLKGDTSDSVIKEAKTDEEQKLSTAGHKRTFDNFIAGMGKIYTSELEKIVVDRSDVIKNSKNPDSELKQLYIDISDGLKNSLKVAESQTNKPERIGEIKVALEYLNRLLEKNFSNTLTPRENAILEAIKSKKPLEAPAPSISAPAVTTPPAKSAVGADTPSVSTTSKREAIMAPPQMNIQKDTTGELKKIGEAIIESRPSKDSLTWTFKDPTTGQEKRAVSIPIK